MSLPTATNGPTPLIAWWREPAFVLVLLFAAVTFCARLTDVPLFGEEPRRALIAREMIESGDWLVPGTQRVFLPSRPPLQNWVKRLAGMALGSIDIWAARLPSILSTFAVATIIYGYLRQQVGWLGSMSGALAYLTMLLVMEFGRSAETEAVFTLFVAASMLLWHWGWLKQWPAWQMWSVGYACAALGMLTKGLQAPVYFGGATCLFLLLMGKGREIFRSGHLIGLLVFAIIFGAWQGPFTWQRGLADSWMIYFGDVAGRFVDRSWTTFVLHLISYPCELLLVGLMPWSALLLAYGIPVVRERLGHLRQTVLFLTVCVVFSFLFVWFPPGSKVRYYIPLFPCFAALIGVAADRLATERAAWACSNLWKHFVRTCACIMVGAAAVVVALSVVVPDLLVSLPLAGALLFAAGSAGLAYAAWRSQALSSDAVMARGLCCVAAFLTLIEISLTTTVQQRRCEDIAGQVESLKHSLPAETHLVSLGPVHHAFAFFYHEPIPIIPLSTSTLPKDTEYFCLHTYDAEPPELQFPWTQVSVVSCDRFKGWPVPRDRVFIGKRLPEHNIGMKDRDSLLE